jgi:hypothetical protein
VLAQERQRHDVRGVRHHLVDVSAGTYDRDPFLERRDGTALVGGHDVVGEHRIGKLVQDVAAVHCIGRLA